MIAKGIDKLCDVEQRNNSIEIRMCTEKLFAAAANMSSQLG